MVSMKGTGPNILLTNLQVGCMHSIDRSNMTFTEPTSLGGKMRPGTVTPPPRSRQKTKGDKLSVSLSIRKQVRLFLLAINTKTLLVKLKELTSTIPW